MSSTRLSLTPCTRLNWPARWIRDSLDRMNALDVRVACDSLTWIDGITYNEYYPGTPAISARPERL